MKVGICGICGKMGLETVKAIEKENDISLILGIDYLNVNKKIKEVIKCSSEILIRNDLKKALIEEKPDVMIELTNQKNVFKNSKIILECKIPIIIGSTGLIKEEIDILKKISKKNKVAVLIVPNFSIGAILMMNFSKKAAKYFKNVEIIEYHHDNKIDSPSGTSLKTAEIIQKEQQNCFDTNKREVEIIKGARGAKFDNLRIHSVRLPGFIAHQEVIFAKNGELLTIKHDSMNRESFMPGIILALRSIKGKNFFIEGLDEFI